MAISTIATTSCTTRMPNTWARTSASTGRARSTELTTIVLEMARVDPSVMQAAVDHPSHEATVNPDQNSPAICTRAVSPDCGRISRSRRTRNSRPTANITSTTPTSDSSSMRWGSANSGIGM